MAYTTDTEVRTQVRRDDRFGGFARTETRQSNLFEPEFKPFAFGQTEDIVASTDQIVASTDQIVASTDQIVAHEPAFEYERQYNFDGKQYETQKREMNITSFEREEQTQTASAYKTNQKVRLNARGKIAITVYSIVVAIIVALCIYNGVMISSISGDIASKSQIVATETQVIKDLEATYNSLGENDYIATQVGDSFKVPTEADTVKVSNFEMKTRKEVKEETNWFEDFCEAIRKLFS